MNEHDHSYSFNSTYCTCKSMQIVVLLENWRDMMSKLDFDRPVEYEHTLVFSTSWPEGLRMKGYNSPWNFQSWHCAIWYNWSQQRPMLKIPLKYSQHQYNLQLFTHKHVPPPFLSNWFCLCCKPCPSIGQISSILKCRSRINTPCTFEGRNRNNCIQTG